MNDPAEEDSMPSNRSRGRAAARLALGAVGVIAAAALADDAPRAEESAFLRDLRAWQAERDSSLRSPDGWLAVAGFDWLDVGENVLGTGDDADVRLPDLALPVEAAVLTVIAEADSFRYRLASRGNASVVVDGRRLAAVAPANAADAAADSGGSTSSDDVSVALRSDASGAPTRFSLGRLTAWVLERGGRPALRLKDPESPLFAQLQALDFHAPDERWVVEGRYQAFPEPIPLAVPSVLGYVDTLACPGAVVFSVQGKEWSLWPMTEDPTDPELFFVFSDGTSGLETYGAGRFLTSTRAEDGRVLLDFNRAYNPPCAYNPYTTCPLPPRQNELPFPIPAGEKLPRMASGRGH